MKNNVEMMRDIKDETYKQINNNLGEDEFLITSLTIYDKNNSLAINLFLTNTAIFMQESTEIEKIKKRLFIKIVDIKLTSDEFYIEFQNGYKIIGDTTECQEEVNRFFECIKVNTTIKTSSTKELENVSYDIPYDRDIPRDNPFGQLKDKKEKIDTEESKEPTFVKTLTDPIEEEPVKKKKPIGLFIGIGAGALVLITTIILIIVLVNSKPKEPVNQELLLVQNKIQEVTNYQTDNDLMYDYLDGLKELFAEYDLGFVNKTKLDIESTFEKVQINYESKFKEKNYSSSIDAYKVHKPSEIDEDMNKNNNALKEIFDLYEDIIDEDYRNEENIIALRNKLTDIETKIKEVQSNLQEEKVALNKLIGIEEPVEDLTPETNENTEVENSVENQNSEVPVE